MKCANLSVLVAIIAAAFLAAGCGQKEGAKAGQLTMAKKAEIFTYDLKARFAIDGQVSPKLKLPTAKRAFVAYNMPDNAYMTGIYVGMLAMQYQASHDPAVRKDLAEALRGLNLLCTVSGIRGLVARAAVKVDAPFEDDGEWRPSADGKYKWRTDVSTDQMDGVMFGYSLGYDVADPAEKAIITRNVTDAVDYILKNDLTILDWNGKPTVWGRYTRNGRVSMAFLQHLKVACQVSGDQRYAREYARFAKEFVSTPQTRPARATRPSGATGPGATTRRSGGRASGEINYSTHMLRWLTYMPLLEMEKDPALRKNYLQSFKQFWEGGEGFIGKKPEANPLFAFTVAKCLGDKSGVAEGVESLRLFPLDMKYNKARLAKLEKKFGFTYDPTPRSPEPQPGKMVPMDRRPKMWSAWVESPYKVGDRTKDTRMEYTGLDYLLAYWYGRSLGYIPATE